MCEANPSSVGGQQTSRYQGWNPIGNKATKHCNAQKLLVREPMYAASAIPAAGRNPRPPSCTGRVACSHARALGWKPVSSVKRLERHFQMQEGIATKPCWCCADHVGHATSATRNRIYQICKWLPKQQLADIEEKQAEDTLIAQRWHRLLACSSALSHDLMGQFDDIFMRLTTPGASNGERVSDLSG